MLTRLYIVRPYSTSTGNLSQKHQWICKENRWFRSYTVRRHTNIRAGRAITQIYICFQAGHFVDERKKNPPATHAACSGQQRKKNTCNILFSHIANHIHVLVPCILSRTKYYPSFIMLRSIHPYSIVKQNKVEAHFRFAPPIPFT